MVLRCFLFSSDEGTSDVIRQVLTALGVEGEICPTPATAVERLSSENFHLAIVDWDQQPEAGMVLSAARERKAADRPLSLAIVSDDASVPQVLQAGANSVLRKPLVASQVMDTLATARDLLRSRLDPAAKPAPTPAGTATRPTSMEPGQEKPLRAGEFLQSSPPKPGGQFITESETHASADQSTAEPIDPLQDLETVAAAAPPRPLMSDEPKGLEWYLKRKGLQSGAAASPAAAPPPQNAKPELLGYDQNPSPRPVPQETTAHASGMPDALPSAHEQKKEAALFAYINGGSEEPQEASPSRFRLGKRAILAALAIAACAMIAAPQAPWHPQMKILWARGQRSLHTWLNPQPVTAVSQAPTSHEDFGRAGDEYKLPVADPIPDATTEPSQIQVLPVVDPTAKKPATDATSSEPPPDATPTAAPEQNPPPAVQVQENPSAQPAPPATPMTTAPAPNTTAPAVVVPAPAPHVEQPPTATVSSTPPAPKRQPTQYVPIAASKVPSSLQSQMVVMTPDASGNKPAEAAMQAIEPVSVPELTERALLAEQSAMSYPASAKGQQGTVILQVLIGRDGAVQDAKFLQGSLAFARTAIDGVRQWKFKPYTMNGRPVSVQTTLTIKFRPAQ